MVKLAILAVLAVVVPLGSVSAAGPFGYSWARSDGIGDQLRAEIAAAPTLPSTGFSVTQNLRSGAITVNYLSQTTDLTAAQKTTVQSIITAHTPAFDTVGDDPPELLLGKVAYGLRRWATLNAAQKDRLAFASALLAVRAMGRWD